MGELVMEEERENLGFGKEEETGYDPFGGGKREP